MTEQHPITPPPELVKQWDAECESGNNAEINSTFDALQQFACKAARWGADQELEACCEWLDGPRITRGYSDALKKHRRPKPPSLKEQALADFNWLIGRTVGNPKADARSKRILQALESLSDD